jgi:hypothetical protein
MSLWNSQTSGLLPSPGHYVDLPPRCLIDRREALQKLRKPGEPLQLRAQLYAFGTDSFVVCATTSISEAGEVVKLPWSASDEALGLAVLDQLLRCCSQPMPNLREVKASTWPAFVASGAKTVRAFEQSATSVSVKTAGTALTIEGCRYAPPSETYIGRTRPITGDPTELGAAIRQVTATVRLLDAENALF